MSLALLLCVSCQAEPSLSMDRLRPGTTEAQCQSHAPFGLHSLPYPVRDYGCYGWTNGSYSYHFNQDRKLIRIHCGEGGNLARNGKIVFPVPGSPMRLQALFGKPQRVVAARSGAVVWDYPDCVWLPWCVVATKSSPLN